MNNTGVEAVTAGQLCMDYTRKLREIMTKQHVSLDVAEKKLLETLRDYGRMHV